MKKERLDKFLVDNGFFDSREKAKKAIMAGLVFLNGQVKQKAGDPIALDTPLSCISIKGDAIPYVSRGGLKLEKGLQVFDFPVENRVFLDIGASTGGFTDCLLQNGARKVYSIDVGYGQLDWKLRNDARVVSMERTNFRKLTENDLPEKADATVMDVSFISIVKLLDTIHMLTKQDAQGIWLIKPQFEAGRENVGKNGVVRDKKIHKNVLKDTLSAIQSKGFCIEGLDFSPIQGPKGNIEFLCLTRRYDELTQIDSYDVQIEEVVERAHATYRKKDDADE